MIKQVVKLIAPEKIQMEFEELDYTDEVLIRPTYLSICAADKRYYFGQRKREILMKKLPLALIHEAVGEVLYDPKGEYKKGENVVMIPNLPTEGDDVIKENYLRSSKFMSSSEDGFMQSIVAMNRGRVISIGDIEPSVASLLEVISVVLNSIEAFKKNSHSRKDVIGVWGNGNLGFTMCLVLKKFFPKSKVVIFGTSEEKLNYFSFVDEKVYIESVPEDLKVDHAFECVGGQKSISAVEQIIDVINPQGTIALLGVSEEPIPMNTRMILEKGLVVIGNSRSSYEDFAKSIELLKEPKFAEYMENVISEVVEINKLNDINIAFNNDLNNPFKTVMKWNL